MEEKIDIKNKNKIQEDPGCGRIKLKIEKIENRKKEIGSKHHRKLKKYSNNFNKIFNFFLQSYRRGLLTFCGSEVIVEYDPNGPDCKEGFRLHEDGYFKLKTIKSRHPNILRSVLIAKKSWGLWVQEWTDGIVDWTFTKEEILSQFDGIEIPESFMNDFENVLHKKKMIRNQKYLESLKQFHYICK